MIEKKCDECEEKALTWSGRWYYCFECWMKRYGPQSRRFKNENLSRVRRSR
jgi:hypothetical protein